MPDMYIDVDTAVALIVNKVALTDDTDFKTRETGIVYNQAGMDLVWNFTTSAGVVTQTAVTPTTAGDYDWSHVGDAVYKIEIPASGGASINNDTEGSGYFSGICTGVLAWVSPIYVFRAAGLNNLLIDDAFSATRALAGTALPAAAADAAGGLIISDAGGLDADANIGALTYTVANQVDSNVITKTGFSLASTGLDAIASTATGMVEIAKAIWDRVLTGATHNIATSAGRRLRGLQDFQTYSSYVWVDTVNGTAGTIAGENGTENNPVLTWADALTLEGLTETPSSRFHLANDTSITFTGSVAAYELTGNGWTLALGGQAIDEAFISGARLSGVGTVTGNHAHIDRCEIDTSTLGNIHAHNSIVNATINMANIGEYLFISSQSGVVGTGQPVFNFGALGAQDLALRAWNGSAELQNMAAGDNCSIDGAGRKVVINANCTGGTLVIAGMFDLEDNSGGAVTIVDEARVDYGQIQGGGNAALVAFFTSSAQLVDDIWDEPLTGATHNVADSSGKRIRDLQEFGTYEGGAIFIDTVNGAAGTTDYESGTILNPVDTVADSNTLATSLGLSRREVAPGSSITFAASQAGQVFNGIGWTLALGGQNLSDTEIRGAQNVSGIATTPTGEAHFFDCELVTGTLGQSHLKFCGLGGTLVLSAAANYTMSDCYSQIPGSPTPIIDFGAAVGNTGISMRRYSGGIEVQNYGATGTDTMSLEGNGQLVIAASCTGGTIYVRGNFKVTDNSGGAVSLVYDDNSTDIAAILDAVASTGVVLTAAERNAIADAMLDRDMSTGTDSGSPTVRTVRQALRSNRNKVSISGGVMTVTKEDDTTASWTAAVATTAGDPISSIDPADS